MGKRTSPSVGALTLLLTGLMLTACAPSLATPSPPPTHAPTTETATAEDQAYRAAEETYRNYVAAVNERRSDANSSPDPETFLTDAALLDHRETERLLEAKGLRVRGSSSVRSVQRVPNERTVWLVICLDATRTTVIDDLGQDVTPKGRADLLGIDVRFVSRAGAMLIAEANTADTQC